MMKWTLLILLILLSPTAGAVNYPQLRGFVTDNANIIDPVNEEKITQLAQTIEKETTVEIAVVTVESLEGETIGMYAVRLFEQAGIGKKDKDNGLLILVARNEREYDFEVGYGLESVVTDSMKVNIGERIIVPNFRNGEYGKGIYEAMVDIQGLLKGDEGVRSKYSMPQSNPPPPDEPRGYDGRVQPDWGSIIFFVILVLFVILIITAENRNDGWTRERGHYGGRRGGGWTYGGHYGGGWSGSGGIGGFGGGWSGGGRSGGGFGGFGGGRSGGGGFRGKW